MITDTHSPHSTQVEEDASSTYLTFDLGEQTLGASLSLMRLISGFFGDWGQAQRTRFDLRWHHFAVLPD